MPQVIFPRSCNFAIYVPTFSFHPELMVQLIELNILNHWNGNVLSEPLQSCFNVKQFSEKVSKLNLSGLVYVKIFEG